MFEALTERLNRAFRDLSGYGKITPENIEPALREIKLALLEADVHFKVVKEFLSLVRERSNGKEVLDSITPAQQFVKIVHDELTKVLGGESAVAEAASNTAGIYFLCGLQGSGKTTAAAKLAHLFGNAALAALDLQRPAAVEQLKVLAERIGAKFIPPQFPNDSRRSAAHIRDIFPSLECKHLIVDTAGRLQIDDELMNELKDVHEIINPSETVMVLDAMTGQEAVKVAEAFRARIGLNSIFLSKTDGDSKGGAALSIRFITGIPIKWIGTGETPQAVEQFHPDRFAGRILGMGDVVSLVEKAAKATDLKQAEKAAKSLMKGKFNFELFLDQMREMKKIGPLSELISMLPGGSTLPIDAIPSEKEVSRFEAIILSMTKEERRNPELINVSRRDRIAKGSGSKPDDVHRLLKQFRQAKEMMSVFSGGKKISKKIGRMFGM